MFFVCCDRSSSSFSNYSVFICCSFFANETSHNVCELAASLVAHTVNTSDFWTQPPLYRLSFDILKVMMRNNDKESDPSYPQRSLCKERERVRKNKAGEESGWSWKMRVRKSALASQFELLMIEAWREGCSKSQWTTVHSASWPSRHPPSIHTLPPWNISP